LIAEWSGPGGPDWSEMRCGSVKKMADSYNSRSYVSGTVLATYITAAARAQ